MFVFNSKVFNYQRLQPSTSCFAETMFFLSVPFIPADKKKRRKRRSLRTSGLKATWYSRRFKRHDCCGGHPSCPPHVGTAENHHKSAIEVLKFHPKIAWSIIMCSLLKWPRSRCTLHFQTHMIHIITYPSIKL
jgi:hypothetical protein